MENKKTIFIVDDDQDYLFQLKLKVEKFGFNVITAESQAEAEEIIKDTKPDLAIYDLMMEHDDSGFILSYKTKNKYPDVPIIIATSVASETGISFGLDTNAEQKWIKADLYLEKGIRADQLHREIIKLLKL
jgi:DNA-binding response OmpR family regulator